MKNNRVVASIAIMAAAVVASMLLACGGHDLAPTKYLFAVDTGNDRVLVYNAPFSTGQSASAALGQASFTSSTVPASPTAASLAMPQLAVDTTGTLYVADLGNCRILQYQPPFTTGMAATLAIGQPAGAANLTSNTCLGGAAATASGLDGPTGVAIDRAGNLWVADFSNSRILKFPAPIVAGEAATVVLGQTSLTGQGTANQGLATPTAATLYFPGALAFDAQGNLWVTDIGNNRVLMYPPANQVTGGSATIELGQPAATAFTSNTANNGGISATSIGMPQTVGVDSQGNVWVADFSNNRVLMYAKASLANGAAATLELGQPAATAFTSGTSNNGGIGPSTMNAPIGIAFDSSGRVYVSEGSNNRVLVFAPPFSNGMSATMVIGQANFTTATGNADGESAATLWNPLGIATY